METTVGYNHLSCSVRHRRFELKRLLKSICWYNFWYHAHHCCLSVFRVLTFTSAFFIHELQTVSGELGQESQLFVSRLSRLEA